MSSWFIHLFGISLAVWIFLCDISRSDGIVTSASEIYNSKICYTVECFQVAIDFLKSLNQSVDPCVDFYQFACGNWKTHHPDWEYGIQQTWCGRLLHLSYIHLREEVNKEPTSEDILPVKQMKKFYKSCVETPILGDVASVNAVLRGVNGWPLIMSNDTWNRSATKWQEVDRYYEELTGINAFFSLEIPNDPSDNAELKIATPSFLDHFARSSRVEIVVMKRTVAWILMQQNGVTIPKEALKKNIIDLLNFEQRLHQASVVNDPDYDFGFDFTREVSFTNITSFVKWWKDNTPSTNPQGQIDWEMILQRLFNITNLPKTDDAPIKLRNVDYFRKLVEILQSTDERIIVNFIHWNFLYQMTIGYGIAEESFMMPILDDSPRWLQCLKPQEPVSIYLFIKKYYGDDRKRVIMELVRNLEKSLELQITNSNWLSVRGKDAAKEKLRRMKHVLGYEDWYSNETAIIDYYKGLTIGEDHFKNVLGLMKNKWEATVKRWGKPVMDKPWLKYQHTVSAWYFIKQHTYWISAGAFQSPLFDGGMPDYVGYGAVGFVIGHEMSHAFTSRGIYYGLTPNVMLFTADMTAIYDERAQCFVDFFDKFPEGRGYSTLEENIADWSGLQTALNAYREQMKRKIPEGELKLPGFLGFNDLQMFFLSFAQTKCIGDEDEDRVHSRPSRRVNGPLSNTLAFAEAFNCPRDSPMNPVRKCNLWMKP